MGSGEHTRSVLAVFAHPDDESLMCGGTLARLADAGVRVVLMCASRGERGSVSDPALLNGSDLGAVRVRELNDAAAVLGVADVLALDHSDGDLRWHDVPEFHADIVAAIERYRPEAVITFAENGFYWHLDHIGVHERTYTAVQSFGPGAPPLYYVTMPKGIIRQIVDTVHAKGGESVDSSFWGIEPDAFGESAMPVSFTIDVRRWVPRKLAALRCHRTQMGTHHPIAWLNDDEACRWLGLEYFRRSPLACSAGETALDELASSERLEGLRSDGCSCPRSTS
jgi:N-acetyl-1-D-myo-inositol-2-amino-2-deoxy-alpha-D-glucopyranoside deacetylase